MFWVYYKIFESFKEAGNGINTQKSLRVHYLILNFKNNIIKLSMISG